MDVYTKSSPGFSLLEVMLSVFILAFALLGLLDLQTHSLRYAYSALLHTQAEIQVFNLSQEFRLTPQVDIQSWELSNQNYFPSSQTQISPSELALRWDAYGLSDRVALAR